MAMAANTIVAENLTLTGSIGVVTGDLSLSTCQRESCVLCVFVKLSLSPSPCLIAFVCSSCCSKIYLGQTI